MLKTNLKRMLAPALAALTIAATLAPARAQSASRFSARLPFAFTVGGRTLPAGEYSFEFVSSDTNRRAFVVRNRRGESVCMEFTRGTAGEVRAQAKLVFHKYGDTFLLHQIWMPGTDTGFELNTRAAFRTARPARNAGAPDVVTYVAGLKR
jgi:hypothetical protein